MSEIGRRVRDLRQRQGWQQEEVAQRVRRYSDGRVVAIETLSRIETGRNEPAAWMLRALAEALETTSDYLLGLADDPGLPNVPRFPVPAPEIVGAVARVNSLPEAQRRAVGQLLEQALDLLEPNARAQRWLWFLDQLSPEDSEKYLRELQERARADGAISLALAPGVQASGY